MAVSVEVWGQLACFTRPEMKVERVSYDVMTPSAARGLLDAIYWHPGLRWRIDRIQVCEPIRFTNLRRNEIKSKVNARTIKPNMERNDARDLFLCTAEEIQQRAALLLQNVRYIIDAHFDLIPEKMTANDSHGKFQEIARRRIERGQFYHQPYFGCREFPAWFKPSRETHPCPEELKGTHDLGWMLYDMDYSDPENIRPRFFRAILQNGVLEVPAWDSEEVKG